MMTMKELLGVTALVLGISAAACTGTSQSTDSQPAGITPAARQTGGGGETDPLLAEADAMIAKWDQLHPSEPAGIIEIKETLFQAMQKGWVGATFRGAGGSSDDTVRVRLARTGAAPSGRLALTVAPGSLLQSVSQGVQDMVVTGVRGRDLGDGRYEPRSEIVVSRTSVMWFLGDRTASVEEA